MSEAAAAEASDDHNPEPKDRKKLWLRVGALAVFLGGTYLIAWATGAQEYFTLEKVRHLVEVCGWGGWLAFLGIFCVGELIHIPGMVFVAAGILAFGKVLGGPLSFAGAVLSVSVSFVVVRGVGGKPLTQLPWAFARKVMARLEDRPIRTVFLLRLLFFMAPPLNYALALSGVKFRDYFIGSALGLIAPMIVMVLAFDWVIGFFTA
jgi:uncharacterized membrane protein YdjX (TVP38/TMEM64 family)